MKIAMMVAAAENRCIGLNNKLPWHLPEDLKFFKRTTIGKPIIMGRKTWDSIGCKPLPGRTNIVITRQNDYHSEHAKIAHSLDEALQLAEAAALAEGADEIMVVGGAGIYELCLPQADKLYYTKVHTEVAGDAFFPQVNWQEWQLLSEEKHPADDRHSHSYSFCVYERVQPAQANS